MLTSVLALSVLFAGAPARAQEDPMGSDAPPMEEEAPKPKPKKKAKPYDYDRSKYKSRDLADGELKTYRFNEKGDPVIPGGKKKPAAAKGKKRSEPPAEKPIERGCSTEMPCKMPDEADAL